MRSINMTPGSKTKLESPRVRFGTHILVRSKVVHLWLMLLVLVMKGQVALADNHKPSSSPFASVVLAHFNEWDLNHNGILEPDELDKLIAQKGIHGDVAAALGTLKTIQRGGKFEVPKLNQNYFKKYAKSARDKKLEGLPPFDSYYELAKQRINNKSLVIFPPDQPSLSAVHQGTLGDCFVLAALSSMIVRDPSSVKQLIVREANGEYTVQFPGSKKVRVAPLTDTELALTSTTQGHGLWLNLFEKAYGQLRTELLDEEKQTLCSTDAICKGGSAGIVIQDLTGHQVKCRNLQPTKKDSTSVEKRIEALHELLTKSVSAKHLLCAGTLSEQKAKSLPSHHAYSILGYDAKSRMVYLFNPHGNTFQPKGEPGLKNGYATKSGRFAMPLADFVECYRTVFYETDQLRSDSK